MIRLTTAQINRPRPPVRVDTVQRIDEEIWYHGLSPSNERPDRKMAPHDEGCTHGSPCYYAIDIRVICVYNKITTWIQRWWPTAGYNETIRFFYDCGNENFRCRASAPSHSYNYITNVNTAALALVTSAIYLQKFIDVHPCLRSQRPSETTSQTTIRCLRPLKIFEAIRKILQNSVPLHTTVVS